MKLCHGELDQGRVERRSLKLHVRLEAHNVISFRSRVFGDVMCEDESSWGRDL